VALDGLSAQHGRGTTGTLPPMPSGNFNVVDRTVISSKAHWQGTCLHQQFNGVDLPVRSSTFLLTSNVTIISCESTLSYPHLRSGSYRVPLTVCLSHLKQPMMPSTTIPSLGSTRSRWNKWPAHSSLRPTSPVSQNPDDAISASTRHTKQV